MNREMIETLVADRSLQREEFSDAQVAVYWAKALGAAADGQTVGLSKEGALQVTYTAALQATMALLAAHGLRVKSTASHYKAFLALQQFGADLRRHGVRFDALRTVRHRSVYEPDELEDIDARLARAAKSSRKHFP